VSAAADRGGAWRRHVQDFRTVLVAFGLSLVLGWALNAIRPDPVAFPYVDRRARASDGIPGSQAAPVSLAEVRQVAERRSGVFVDARETFFFEEGRLPGAINLPVAQAEDGLLSGIPADRETLLIVYCSGGDCEDSRTVARLLREAGYRNVRVFEGGWEEWEASPR